MTLLGWNTNGQMTSMVQPNQDRFRKHLWDETGQLAAVIGNDYCGYYGYNAHGERVYKLTGTVYADQYNAGDVNIETYFDDIVLYVNPYMVVTPRGYTKHYYNGSQRIAARLGDYWATSVAYEPDMVAHAREVLEQTMNSGDVEEEHFGEYVRSIDGEEFYLEPFTLYTHYRTCSYSEDMLYEALNGGARFADHIGGIDQGIFYYHPDHLGSSSWITDDQVQVVQYIHYMPFGELWENQQLSEYEERFKFTGKERDTETGYDYFGARYYASALPMWLSVDPLANEYPDTNPYAYCAWNPIKYVDPDGKKIVIGTWYGRVLAKLGVDNFERQTMNNLKELKAISHILNTAISKIEDSQSITVYIHPMSEYNEELNKGVIVNTKETPEHRKESDIYDVGFIVNGDYSSPQAILAHELGHAENHMEGTTIEYNKKKALQGDKVEAQKGNLNEQKSISYENIVRKSQGDGERSYNYYQTDL